MWKVPKEYEKKAEFYLFFVVLITIIVLVLLYLEKIGTMLTWLFSILFPFILGLGFAFVLNVISNGILRFFHIKDSKWKRRGINVISILLVMLILSFIVFNVIPQALASIGQVIQDLPGAIKQTSDVYEDLVKKYPTLRSETIPSFDNLSSVFLGTSKVVDTINKVISTTISWMMTGFLSFVFSVFVLFNKKTLKKDVVGTSKAFLPSTVYVRLRHIYYVFADTFAKYIGGSIIECIILGTLVFIGATILRLPYAILCGVSVAIGALVPMFGALFMAVVCALLIALQSPIEGLTFIIMFILIQQVEGNFIYPNVVGKSVGLPPMYVLLAVTLGASIGGILGMIVFIPLFSSLYRLLLESIGERLKKQNDL